MPSLSTLFFTLSALAVGAQAAPSSLDPRGADVGAVFAGAPSDGVYPEDMSSAVGWESEGYKPTYEQPAGDSPPADSTVTWSTTISAGVYATPVHGSGSTPPTDLNSCQQMCQAQFGGGGSMAPPAEGISTHATSTSAGPGSTSASAHATSAAPPPPPGGSAPPAEAGGGGGATHTIIVAPTQGVLRFVPFAVKAEQGDSLHYIWGGGPHSATLSNGTNVCSKSTEPGAFDSGKLNATATFETTYDKNTTGPTFFYCTVGQHCTNGMFGVINPPSSNVSNALTDKATGSAPPRPDSTAGSGGNKFAPGVDGWMTSWGLTNPDNQKKIDAVKAACKNTPGAWDWGSKWDWESTLSVSVTKEIIVENTLYTRLMASYNPAMLSGQPLPQDWKAAPDLTSFAANYTGAGTAGASGSSSAGSGAYGSSASTDVAAASPSASADAAQSASPNGAGRVDPTSLFFTAVAALAVGTGFM